MAEPDPTPTPDDPTAAELAALRKEKADRDAADRDAKAKADGERDAELAALRKEKADRDAADAKKVTPPKKKIEKVQPPAPDEDQANEPKRARVSKLWYGDSAYE